MPRTLKAFPLDIIASTGMPRGFDVSRFADDQFVITYTSSGRWPFPVLLSVLVLGAVCGYALARSDFVIGQAPVHFGIWALSVLAWGIVALSLGGYFRLVSRFDFTPERLGVEHKRFGLSWRREIPKVDIEVVRQVYQCVNSLHGSGWGLAVIGYSNARLLSGRNVMEKAGWLGPIVAAWAGVGYQSWETRKNWKV